MTTKRIIATLPIKNNIVVQSIGFGKYLPVGRAEIAVEFLNSWGIDEIILQDIDATKNRSTFSISSLKEITKKSFVPITVAGGITTVEQVDLLLKSGADKIAVNNCLFKSFEILKDITQRFGKQCVIASIDFVKDMTQPSGFAVYNYFLKKNMRLDLLEWAKECEEFMAGEILLHSVDRDGMYTGFEIAAIKEVSKNLSIPVIASAGARTYRDFDELFFKTTACAGAAGNMFHFTEHSVIVTKSKLLSESNHPIRLETKANYVEQMLDNDKRLSKYPDTILEEMLFMKHKKETI